MFIFKSNLKFIVSSIEVNNVHETATREDTEFEIIREIFDIFERMRNSMLRNAITLCDTDTVNYFLELSTWRVKYVEHKS